jgi:hypothetical protein
LYIKPHTIIANKEYDLTPVASAHDPDHSRVVETHALARGVKIGKIEAYYLSCDSSATGQGPQMAEGDVLDLDKRR